MQDNIEEESESTQSGKKLFIPLALNAWSGVVCEKSQNRKKVSQLALYFKSDDA